MGGSNTPMARGCLRARTGGVGLGGVGVKPTSMGLNFVPLRAPFPGPTGDDGGGGSVDDPASSSLLWVATVARARDINEM